MYDRGYPHDDTVREAYRDVYECLASWGNGYYWPESNYVEIMITGSDVVDATWVDDVVNVVTLEEALMEITVRQREALFRDVILGETDWEIGRAMGVTRQTATELISLGVKGLARVFLS